jgi:hypothetical protein
MMQYRHGGPACVPRVFDWNNGTQLSGAWALPACCAGGHQGCGCRWAGYLLGRAGRQGGGFGAWRLRGAAPQASLCSVGLRPSSPFGWVGSARGWRSGRPHSPQTHTCRLPPPPPPHTQCVLVHTRSPHSSTPPTHPPKPSHRGNVHSGEWLPGDPAAERPPHARPRGGGCGSAGLLHAAGRPSVRSTTPSQPARNALVAEGNASRAPPPPLPSQISSSVQSSPPASCTPCIASRTRCETPGASEVPARGGGGRGRLSGLRGL